MLECSACGSRFKPEEIEAQAKPYREDLKPEQASKVYNSDEADLMDCPFRITKENAVSLARKKRSGRRTLK